MIKATKTSRTGTSMLEVIASTLLVGVVIVGALDCAGSVVRGRMSHCDEARACVLAQQLLTEILAASYRDPGPLPLFGPELDELLGLRSQFDDVDDYHLWSESPPTDWHGVAVPNSTNWQRDVVVKNVDPLDPRIESLTSQGMRRVTVTVRFRGKVVAEVSGLACEN